MALGAESSSPEEEHRWVLRSVWAVAFVAAASTEPCHGVVFVDERSGLVGMTGDALALERALTYLRRLGGMHRMAVATNQLAFGNGVMEIQPELGEFGLVTLSAKRHFIGLKHQLLFWLLSDMNDADWRLRLAMIRSSGLKGEVSVRMYLVTRHA